jgi:DNA recombination protein RmuC
MEPFTIGAFVALGATSALAAAYYVRSGSLRKRADDLTRYADDLAAQIRAREVELATLNERIAGFEQSLRDRTAELAKLQQSLNDKSLACGAAQSAEAAAGATRDELQRKFDERMKEFTAQKSELEKARADYALLADKCTAAQKQLASADSARVEERKAFDERMEDLKNLRKEMEAAFAKLSSDALSGNSEQFLKLANERLTKLNEQNSSELEKHKKAVEELVKPLNDAMSRVGESVKAFDKSRDESFAKMAEKITSLAGQEESLRRETASLGEALRKPNVRGAWGEMQLRRVVEFAGMVDRCHFKEQVAISDADRPDMIVDLPNGLLVVVDAKAPMQAYLEALQVNDAAKRDELMQGHVRQIRDRIKKLSQKKYTDQLDVTPDFTVLFLPAESLFSTALELDPDLLNYGIGSRVILATPTTLIALLLAVAAGWQDRRIADNAMMLKKECDDLYASVCSFLDHYEAVGTGLEKAISAYNRSVGSLQTRLLPKARKINELGGFDKDGEKLLKATPEEIAETNARRIEPTEAK